MSVKKKQDWFTHGEPLFRASDIGEILGLKKIRNSISDFNETEKVARPMGTPGGIQEVLLLTDIGLYRLLGQCRKPIALPFQFS